MAKGKKKTTKRAPSKRSFMGDRVLCAYLLLTCCCVPGWVATGAKQEPELPINESIRELLADRRISGFLERPDAALLLSVPIMMVLIGWIWVLISVWRSRLWALWLLLFLYLPGTIYSAWARDWISAVPGVAVVVYCALRVFQVVGPRG